MHVSSSGPRVQRCRKVNVLCAPCRHVSCAIVCKYVVGVLLPRVKRKRLVFDYYFVFSSFRLLFLFSPRNRRTSFSFIGAPSDLYEIF